MHSVVAAKIYYDAHAAAVPACLVLVFAAAHLILLGLPSVNMEGAFNDASEYFSDGNRLYFYSAANTLAMPWLAFAN